MSRTEDIAVDVRNSGSDMAIVDILRRLNYSWSTIQLFLERGYIVLWPIRKGFSLKGITSVAVSAGESEPIVCNDYNLAEKGLASAMAGVKALINWVPFVFKWKGIPAN